MPKRMKKYQGSPLAMFGPLYVTDGDGGGAPSPSGETGSTPVDAPVEAQPKPSDVLGEGGKKALEREREARKALEGQVSQMRDAFAQALGVKADSKTDVGDLLGTFQQRLDAMQHENTVERVARVNGITDDADIEFLRSAKDEDHMNKLAVRLKAASEPAAPGTPKPDRTQGPQGSENKPDPGPGVPRLAQAFEDALNQ